MADGDVPPPLTNLDQLLAGGAASADGRRYHIGPDWMQGRTAYGGIAAAIALDSAMQAFPGAAPLRTAQVSFVGPVGGECSVAARLLRESKSSRFVAADVTSDLGYGTNAVFTFMQPRDSHIDHERTAAPDVADPDRCETIPDHPMRPAFTRKFEMRPSSGRGFGHGLDEASIVTWVRWIEPPGADPFVAMLALADALPPAALTLFHKFGPISSSTWVQHFLVDAPQTNDGWWLLVARSPFARRGFSPQTMEIWNSERELVSVGGQGVALYV